MGRHGRSYYSGIATVGRGSGLQYTGNPEWMGCFVATLSLTDTWPPESPHHIQYSAGSPKSRDQ